MHKIRFFHFEPFGLSFRKSRKCLVFSLYFFSSSLPNCFRVFTRYSSIYHVQKVIQWYGLPTSNAGIQFSCNADYFVFVYHDIVITVNISLLRITIRTLQSNASFVHWSEYSLQMICTVVCDCFLNRRLPFTFIKIKRRQSTSKPLF